MRDSFWVHYVWMVPAASFLAATITPLVGRWRPSLAWVPCLSAGLWGALWSALLCLVYARSDPSEAVRPVELLLWLKAGRLEVPLELWVDPLAVLMLLIVTVVGSLIVAYSVWYMAHEEGYPRFFAEMALFLGSMTGLVLAGNLLLLYVFWELVGLCSYLLIGFYFTRPAAAAAATKAFVVTRLGDFGFALGVLTVWTLFGSLRYQEVLQPDAVQQVLSNSGGTAGAVCSLLLFCGAIGKSAQFPLHVWLPDAMEGPTPVSALIHAATMVTAGVYMVARFHPIFFPNSAEAALVESVVASIGAFTAFLAALIATAQTDLKRILAYSTISQLGYMFLALGTGSPLGAVAAMWHVFTHAFFKALLFLGAGSVMHATGGELNIWRMGGLARSLPVTHGTFLCGALALAGVPPFAGFWSKDAVLESVASAAGQSGLYQILLGVSVATALLTAFYAGRVYWLVFAGSSRDPQIDEHVQHYVHQEVPEPGIMRYPLIVLALGSVGLGLLTWSVFGGLQPFQAPYFGSEKSAASHDGHGWIIPVLSTVTALCGFGLAYWGYARQPGAFERLVALWHPLYEACRQKFWFDELYLTLIVRRLLGFAHLCRYADHLMVDGLVRAVAAAPAWSARFFLRPMHNGLLQLYALAMLIGLAIVLCFVVGS
jgi:NADH-quinone oxidoreductase subunit L